MDSDLPLEQTSWTIAQLDPKVNLEIVGPLELKFGTKARSNEAFRMPTNLLLKEKSDWAH